MQYANIFYICVATYNAGKWQWNVLNFTLNVPLTKMIFVHMTQYSSNVPKHILALRAKRLLLHRSASNSMYLGTAHWGVYKAALWRSLSPRKCYLSDFGVMLPNTQTHFFSILFSHSSWRIFERAQDHDSIGVIFIFSSNDELFSQCVGWIFLIRVYSDPHYTTVEFDVRKAS